MLRHFYFDFIILAPWNYLGCFEPWLLFYLQVFDWAMNVWWIEVFNYVNQVIRTHFLILKQSWCSNYGWCWSTFYVDPKPLVTYLVPDCALDAFTFLNSERIIFSSEGSLSSSKKCVLFWETKKSSLLPCYYRMSYKQLSMIPLVLPTYGIVKTTFSVMEASYS